MLNIFHLLFLYIVSNAVSNYFVYIARGYGKNVLFALSGVISAVINVVINLVLYIINFNLDMYHYILVILFHI